MLSQVSPPNAVVLTARAQAWHAFQPSRERLRVFNMAKGKICKKCIEMQQVHFENSVVVTPFGSFWLCPSMIFNVRKIQLNTVFTFVCYCRYERSLPGSTLSQHGTAQCFSYLLLLPPVSMSPFCLQELFLMLCLFADVSDFISIISINLRSSLLWTFLSP